MMALKDLLGYKQVAYAVLVIGVIGALLSILIDPIRGEELYMATIQIVVLVVGIVVALIGAYLAFMYKPAPPPE
jgi:hypothetical protein